MYNLHKNIHFYVYKNCCPNSLLIHFLNGLCMTFLNLYGIYVYINLIERAGRTPISLQYIQVLLSIIRLHYFFFFLKLYYIRRAFQNKIVVFILFFFEFLLLLFLVVSFMFVWIDFTYVKGILFCTLFCARLIAQLIFHRPARG